jgi:DNA (cytosine-5)-methyltransferase 1
MRNRRHASTIQPLLINRDRDAPAAVPSGRLTAIDLFAGAGGFSEAARLAGVSVLLAANHWKTALKWHSVNNPGTVHLCQDLQQADWRDVPAHDVILASPSCTGHSRARGKEQAHHDTTRSTAWAVPACAEYHRSPYFIVENVPEFRRWVLYPSWCDAMTRLGYALEEHVLDSADFGVPQHRKRLFIVGARGRAKLNLNLDPYRVPHVGVETVIEWDRHEDRWSHVDVPGRSAATVGRWQRGRARFGERFVAPYYSSGSGLTGRCLSRPIGTLTTRDRWSLFNGERMRMLQVSEARAIMGFRPDYQLAPGHADAMMLLGNAVTPPVPAALLMALQHA